MSKAYIEQLCNECDPTYMDHANLGTTSKNRTWTHQGENAGAVFYVFSSTMLWIS